jgi:hypothetical protein
MLQGRLVTPYEDKIGTLRLSGRDISVGICRVVTTSIAHRVVELGEIKLKLLK